LELNQSKAEAKAKGEGRVEAERSAGRAGGDGDASLARCGPTHSAQVLAVELTEEKKGGLPWGFQLSG